MREGLSEEELAIFDLLTQQIVLNEKERDDVKRIAKALTDKMQDILVIGWRKKQCTQGPREPDRRDFGRVARDLRR